jgi:serine phosphatase RsbU (regulator of sigma subunit)
MLLSTDGLLDQPAGLERLEVHLKSLALPRDYDVTLHEAVVQLVTKALGKHPQFDDITLVTVRRR